MRRSSVDALLPCYAACMSWLGNLFADLSARTGAPRASLKERLECASGSVLDVDMTVSPRGSALPSEPLERLRAETIVSRDFRDLVQWDRVREYDPKIYGWPKNKQRGQSRGTIDWRDLTTIVLHTAGVNGLHPDRWLGVPGHIAVANDATVVLCHELNTYLWAAHAANKYSCSLEIAGNQTITAAQLKPARECIRYMVDEIQRHRPGPVKLIPHRCTHKSRPNDCGAEIWEAVGEWALENIDGVILGDVVGSGRPLPFPPAR